MKHLLIGVLLFVLQIYFALLGVGVFESLANPFLLFAVSVSIAVYLIRLKLKPISNSNLPDLPRFWNRGLWAMIGLLTILVAYEELRKAFKTYGEYEKWSDVIPQVKILYERFSRGEFPYGPIGFTGYDLEPVYMPLHWMPSGLGVLFHIDIRWIGFIFLALSAGIYGWYLSMQAGKVGTRILALILPSLPLWGYILWRTMDLSVSYEIIVGAYYLLLATGLLTKRLWLVTLGIILCLLSRYTLVFWMPLFALLLLWEKGWKKSLLVWSVVAGCFIALYIIPFYSKDPTMLSRGLHHYAAVTVGEWEGWGNPPVSWTLDSGISFAPVMKASFSGEMAHRVYLARIIQGIVLLIVFLAGLWAYKRWKDRIDMFTFSLIGLYVFLTIYYFFAPLTYRYYLFSFLTVSAVMCGQIIMHPARSSNKSNP